MKKAIKKFIRELQESSEERKTRWLYGSSAVVFVFVMVFWVSFIKMEVSSSSNLKNINAFATIKLGMESTYNSFIKAVKSENIFEFSKEKYNFVLDGLPKIKISSFPKDKKTNNK
ncbi:MAG: hypothetical protein A2430_02275 [Candidatus Liptonbacteria bacterium RIFOXYC1_FULL_36_8]|uniref:Uncharacterized protein n=3 Tax=Candidatus Liptoniibacteriota TaxID=1817909 RepID=A0A1G2CM01_9BACT|nr:MAG: hypothetical protein A2390_00900 [Candidatus Liptonbacteria bacterium RIFOXYB1_FULL_36_10]OGZ02884.1 MAG: hypothetical protein A2430_02275 [Candidatus Liptonbacteria bacterium RIFOXYC1_FULL_36_8]OGZ03579.1 MAG: hypothetical protein A2604_00270 [Candidatus Liptonbacteria bacterium RIFOXYD1_FULL_36_11]